VRVEIWSDMVCPWCYVGTRRFDEAVTRLRADGVAVEVVHRAFELDPGVPPGGQDLAEYLARKFGSSGRVAASHARLDLLGTDVGIDFRWEGKRRVNTFDAHRLAAWALEVAGTEAQAALVQRLFLAYFTENLDIADHDVLARLAGDVSFDPAAAAEALSSGAHAATVRDEERRAGERDIHAVPTFVVDGGFAIPGAQDTGTFVRLLAKLA
jgi:predicted DsbA family dithiol-disulfide isomerase